MLRITCIVIAICMLVGCFGSSNSSDKSTTKPPAPQANYSYYFADQSGIKIYSFDHETSDQKLVFSNPTELEYSTQTDAAGVISFGVLFMFKEGQWQFVTPRDNTVKLIAEGSNIIEVCDSFAVQGDKVTYLYYATPGADGECSDQVDNVSYRIDTSMEADAAPLVIDSELFLAEERQEVIANNRLQGFLVKKKFSADSLLFTNDTFTSTSKLEDNVNGYIRTTYFPNHGSIIVAFDNKLFDVTPDQLAAGNIGEPFYSGSNINVHSSRNQFYYSEGKKLYYYDLEKKQSRLVHELDSGYYGDLEVKADGVLVHLDTNSADFLLINTSDLDAVTAKSLTLESSDSSSRMDSIVGGFTYYVEKIDGSKTAYFVSDSGDVSKIHNSIWVNTPFNGLSAGSEPVLLTFGDATNTLSKWSVATRTNDFIYGEFPKEVVSIRTDSNIASDTILLSTYSVEGKSKGLLYVFDVDKANSLKLINSSSEFTVAN